MVTAPGERRSFTVQPDLAAPAHFRVRVFATRKALRAYLRNGGTGQSLGHHGIAICLTWTEATGTELGEILFTTRSLTADTIAHEATHAVFGWAQRIGLHPLRTPAIRQHVTPDEERFAYALGELVWQITAQTTPRNSRRSAGTSAAA